MTTPTQSSAADARNHHPPSAEEVRGSSIGELMRQVTSDLSTLMRQEVELAKAEIRQEGKKAGKAAGLFGGAGFGAYMVALFLSLALWGGLSNVMDAGWAGLIVAVLWAAIAALLYTMGRRNAERIRGLKQTNDSVQRIPDALKPHPEGVTR
ncbi:phage holin family protein [Verrucosispora sp. WMMA2044]|uniref:Phage holin family protein n=2 Tax=Verrucosispora sioxanthis TaxID=2499994 RepID=A0A6M1LB99_9ACTN|nr:MULTISPECIES: phage holin family protein [Micromonospora]NEE66420.1 phage holin family protein [Verrucosispora sioxanthis]NGM15530.1 phage holin family protein [Verrucosispora sioxanthis]WBB49555.1 phage holin family protein [Verrucosispora sp. WMMA2044]